MKDPSMADDALRLSPITRTTAAVFGVLFILMGVGAIPMAVWLFVRHATWVSVVGAACMTGAARLGWVMLQAGRTGYSPPWDSMD